VIFCTNHAMYAEWQKSAVATGLTERSWIWIRLEFHVVSQAVKLKQNGFYHLFRTVNSCRTPLNISKGLAGQQRVPASFMQEDK